MTAPTNEEIAAGVLAIVAGKVAELRHAEPPALRPDSTLFDELGLDPLDIVECVIACEERFGVALPDEALQGADATVADLIALAVAAVRSGKAAADA